MHTHLTCSLGRMRDVRDMWKANRGSALALQVKTLGTMTELDTIAASVYLRLSSHTAS
jgi:hypothetical protein